MRRGEIWWSTAPLGTGSRKRRPFLIVSDDLFNGNARYPKVMAVHLTSVRRAGDAYGWEVDLPRGAGGLPLGSIVKCGEIYTIAKDQLTARLGTLPGEHLARVDRALGVALSLPLAPDARPGRD